MQHLGPMGQHPQGLPAVPEGWIWTPNGPIPPRDFFPPPLSREKFVREQNAQLEEVRQRDERRQAMLRERNEQRVAQGQSSRGGSSAGGRGRAWQEQGYRGREQDG